MQQRKLHARLMVVVKVFCPPIGIIKERLLLRVRHPVFVRRDRLDLAIVLNGFRRQTLFGKIVRPLVALLLLRLGAELNAGSRIALYLVQTAQLRDRINVVRE